MAQKWSDKPGCCVPKKATQLPGLAMQWEILLFSWATVHYSEHTGEQGEIQDSLVSQALILFF